MYVEQRTYTLRPGCITENFAIYEERGMPVQLRYLPIMLGYYANEIGSLNEVIHLWGHNTLDARDINRERMRADPDFQLYWKEIRSLIVAQRTQLMKPAPFFANRLLKLVEAASE